MHVISGLFASVALARYRDEWAAAGHACDASLFRVPESAARARADRGTPGSPLGRFATRVRARTGCLFRGSTCLDSQSLLALSLIEIGTLQRSAAHACPAATWPRTRRAPSGREAIGRHATHS